MDDEIQGMINYATSVVDPIADDDWANVCRQLMPTFCRWERLECERQEQELREQEEARQAEEERIAEEERQALYALCERQKQDRNQRVTRQRAREQEKDSGHLSPSSSRAVAKRKSGSSIGESGSGEKAPEEKGKGKGKAKAPEGPVELKDPIELPVGSIEVGRLVPYSLSDCF